MFTGRQETKSAGGIYLMTLDFNLRFRIHALMEWLQRAVNKKDLPGIVDLTPGIRSLHIRFDSRILSRDKLVDTLLLAEKELPSVENMEVASRIVHCPSPGTIHPFSWR